MIALALVASFATSARAEDDNNVCALPSVAGEMIDQLNSMRRPSMVDAGISIIDLEGITTIAGDSFACHFTAVFNNEFRVPGTLSAKTNAAGNPISTWTPDALVRRHR
jgi:hypothetical protein